MGKNKFYKFFQGKEHTSITRKTGGGGKVNTALRRGPLKILLLFFSPFFYYLAS